jgi:hypothetical protein
MYVERNSEARSRNHCCRGKAINITYSECLSVALVMPACNAHAPSHLRPALPYFSTLPHKQQTIFGKTLLKIKFVL